MTPIPASAAIIEIQVSSATRSRRNRRPNNAATKGAALRMKTAWATVVSSMAKMKAMKAPPRVSATTSPGQPMARKARDVSRPCRRAM